MILLHKVIYGLNKLFSLIITSLKEKKDILMAPLEDDIEEFRQLPLWRQQQELLSRRTDEYNSKKNAGQKNLSNLGLKNIFKTNPIDNADLASQEKSWLYPSDTDSPSKDMFKPLKDLVSVILIADFFLVLAFLLWFLVAAAFQQSNPFILEK